MIAVENLTLRAGTFAIEHLSFAVGTGQYAVLMGKTGSGKTTILEAICGLRKVVTGAIKLQGVDVTRWSPADRGIGYVPQDLTLFRTMTVVEQLAFALTVRRRPKAEIARRVGEIAEMLGISSLLQRGITGLSGGEAQRVAIGRALASEPLMLLLDEPLSALDETTRAEMCELLRRVQKQVGVTFLHVTHNSAEAATLADQMLLLRDGQITSTPRLDH